MSEANTKTSYGVTPPAYRLPDAAHVGAVHLQVSDIVASVGYYERVLGFRASGDTAETATLGPCESTHPLVTLRTRPGVSPARRGVFGLYHFAILLPDRAALGRFAAHLASLDVRVAMADHLVSEALYLRDPDGLGIEVYADRPREAWRTRGRELMMATDPLDIRDLVAAGQGATWTGMPAGTRMGHVHLHVGDLADAEAFYHRGLGLDKTVWSYPGALFMSAGGYHHHVAANTWASGPRPAPDEARLLEWELIVPGLEDVSNAAASMQPVGAVEGDGESVVSEDPWGTCVRIRTVS